MRAVLLLLLLACYCNAVQVSPLLVLDDLTNSENLFRFWLDGRQTSFLTNYPFTSPGKTNVSVQAWVTNTNTTSWPVGISARLLSSSGNWTSSTFFTNSTSETQVNQTLLFEGTVEAPLAIGISYLVYGLYVNNNTLLQPAVNFTVYVESTCNDGIFCNGYEYLVNGSCVSLDNDPCSTDKLVSSSCLNITCDEEYDLCHYSIPSGAVDCEVCAGCLPNCTSANGTRLQCGGDGCGGLCGSCLNSLSCVEGFCVSVNLPGTCANPIPLIADNATLAMRHVIQGDTTEGYFSVAPECNAGSNAQELVYMLTIPEGPSYGITAQYSGFDTVLDIRSGSCNGPSVSCSDDSYPPGDYGSMIQKLLPPGDYYILCSGYNSENIGPFTLRVDLYENCLPRCSSLYCGADGCGGDCGPCTDGQTCTEGRCISPDCKPNCTALECGDDGCGGSCGDCALPTVCNRTSHECVSFVACDHLQPRCDPPCGQGQFCGTNCACFNLTDPLPDLYIIREPLFNEIHIETLNFSSTDCAVVEGCIISPGVRRVLRFTVQTANQGSGQLVLGDPAAQPEYFVYSPCHGHYHFAGYSNYLLLNTTEPYESIVLGRKQGYCVYDGFRFAQGPTFNCGTELSCASQGISPGWVDNYGWSLDCQWVDITDVPAGDYLLFVEINYLRKIVESSYDNNIAYVNVTIPPWDDAAPQSQSPQNAPTPTSTQPTSPTAPSTGTPTPTSTGAPTPTSTGTPTPTSTGSTVTPTPGATNAALSGAPLLVSILLGAIALSLL